MKIGLLVLAFVPHLNRLNGFQTIQVACHMAMCIEMLQLFPCQLNLTDCRFTCCTVQRCNNIQRSNGDMQRVHRCFPLTDSLLIKKVQSNRRTLCCYSTIVQKCLYTNPWMVSTPSWFNLLEMRAQNVFILLRVHLLTRHHFHFFSFLLLLLFMQSSRPHLFCRLCLCRFRFIRCVLVWRSHSFRCHTHTHHSMSFNLINYSHSCLTSDVQVRQAHTLSDYKIDYSLLVL